MAKKDGDKGRRKSERFESEEPLDADKVAGYLEALAQGLRDGNVVLGDDAAGFDVRVNSPIELDVEARRRKKKTRLDIGISFRQETPDGKNRSSSDDDKEAAEVATIPDEMSF